MEATANQQIGARLAELRKELNLTQSEIGDAIGKTRAAISVMESGKSAITVETLMQLSESFGANIGYLLFGDPHPMFTNSSTKTQSVRGSYNRTEMDVNHINDPSSGGDPEKEYLKKRIEDLEKQVDEYRRLYQALLDKL